MQKNYALELAEILLTTFLKTQLQALHLFLSLFLPGAPNVLSGRFAGLLETVAKRHDALDFSCVVSLYQSHVSLSNRHSPTRI